MNCLQCFRKILLFFRFVSYSTFHLLYPNNRYKDSSSIIISLIILTSLNISQSL
nr:MAG TPA: hypothetical protein [Caudoviricetes sp.]